jgi:hypothetical protein
MLIFFINRAGRQLARARRAELEKAKRIMQAMIATGRPRRQRGPGNPSGRAL